MRRPNRNIEIFSLSVLDVFSAAMGSFIIVSVILSPYYMKNEESVQRAQVAESNLAECKSTADSLQNSISTAQRERDAANQQRDAAQQQRDAAQEQNASCRQAAATTFLVIVADWQGALDAARNRVDVDVDLHVIDPEGHEFYWNSTNKDKTRFPATPAELSYDNVTGPGIEMWHHPRASAGTYCVAYHLYNWLREKLPSPVIKVSGKVFYRNGSTDLPPATLTSNAPLHVVGLVDVANDGSVNFHESSTCPSQKEPWQLTAGNRQRVQ